MFGTLCFNAGCVFAEHGCHVWDQATGATSEGSVRDGQTPGGSFTKSLLMCETRTTNKRGAAAHLFNIFYQIWGPIGVF